MSIDDSPRELTNVSDEQLKEFVNETFLTGKQAAGGEIRERLFVRNFCDSFVHLPEDRERVLDSHARIIRRLMQLFPSVNRVKREGTRRRAVFLTNITPADPLETDRDAEKFRWSELKRFVEERCVVDGKDESFVSIQTLRDEYEAFKTLRLEPTSIGISKRIDKLCGPEKVRRSVHRINGKNTRCLSGIKLKIQE